MHVYNLLPVLLFVYLNPSAADTTDGFSAVPLSDSNFDKQKPYNLPLSERYSFIDGVHRFWVFDDDKPLRPDSPTKPRTEIRISGYDYSSGVWQFEGQVYIPTGTTGTSVMQIHQSNYTSRRATAMMLWVYDGKLSNYRFQVVESDAYNRWITVNVIHEVEANRITIYIDGTQMLQDNAKGSGPGIFDFKFGVYTQNDSSHYMESRWKDVRILRR